MGDVEQQIACQMDKCAGNPDPVTEIDIIENITTSSGPDKDDFLEFNNTNATDYGDCANLGAGLSSSTGEGAWTTTFPTMNSIFGGGGGFSLGYDNSLSVLVGGDFTCKSGAGFEGRGVFLSDMTLELGGCERLGATAHGSLIHSFENTVCVEVGGDVNIDASFQQSKYIMYEYGNAMKSCHFVYKDDCTVNGAECPTNMTVLEQNNVYTNGDFKQIPDLDLSRWDDELDVLKQKVKYWDTLDANGVAEPPKDLSSAHTVKFKVDNPFTNHTDIYIKHVKKVGKFAMDPTCESMPFTAGCQREAPTIEVGCHEYNGGYGIIESTFEIQCPCPDTIAEA